MTVLKKSGLWMRLMDSRWTVGVWMLCWQCSLLVLPGIGAGAEPRPRHPGSESARSAGVKQPAKTQRIRVHGGYRVDSVTEVPGSKQSAEAAATSYYVISLKALSEKTQPQLLRLETEHVHLQIRVGLEAQIEAWMASEPKSKDLAWEAQEIRVQLPNPMPNQIQAVWMVSRKLESLVRAQKNNGPSYLQRHHPSNDYLVF